MTSVQTMIATSLRKAARRWLSVRGRASMFGRDRRGAAAVEFAMIGVLCIGLIVETMQAGLYFYTSASLERATGKAVRQIMTGSVSGQSLTAAQFRSTVLCPMLPAAMSCANIITNISTVSEDVAPNGFYSFVNATQSAVIPPTMDNTQTSFCAGTTSSVIYAQIYYAMPVISPVWRAIAATNWNGKSVAFVNSAAAFKNEPFQGTTQPAGC
jgi:Flp pilus assembly protein TadG